MKSNGSIPAKSKSSRLNKGPRGQLEAIARKSGCHSCGAMKSGTKSGRFIAYHQPLNALAGGRKQRFYPHCTKCSSKQGAQVNRYKKYKLRR